MRTDIIWKTGSVLGMGPDAIGWGLAVDVQDVWQVFS